MNSSCWVVCSLILCALNSSAHAGVDEPQGCWSRGIFPCAYRSEKPEWLEMGKIRFRTTTGTAIVRKSAGEIQLLLGQLWVENAEGLNLSYPGREFVITGDVWIHKERKRLHLQQFSGETRIRAAIAGDVLPTGFENWWDLSSQGILQPLASRKVLTKWNDWLNLDQKEARERIGHYKEAWKDRIEIGSEFYREVIQRRTASAEQKEDQKHKKSVQLKAEQKNLREMSRARFFEH